MKHARLLLAALALSLVAACSAADATGPSHECSDPVLGSGGCP